MMSPNRTVKRSFPLAAAAVAVATLASPWVLLAQQSSVLKPFESGRFEEALQAASENRDDPATTFVAGQAAIKLGQLDRAREEFSRLESNGDRTWELVGRSAKASLADDHETAMNVASEAVESGGDNPYARYQLGMAAAARGDYGRAAEAFDRAAALKPDFAYAHYYAGMAFQKQRQVGKAGEHFNRFLELAPDAPERSAVVSIMRTMRG